MTALTPEQMRALAGDAEACALDPKEHPVDRVQFGRYSTALNAAADEQERLLALLKSVQKIARGSHHEASNHRAEVNRLRLQRDNSDRRALSSVEAMQSFAADNDRLRAVIENAPHMTSCYTKRAWPKGRSDAECDCWKANAL